MFPIQLAIRVIRLYTDEGDIVLDPFLGSGTTAVAAIKTNRRFIGIEKMKQYYDIANKIIKAAQTDFKCDMFKSVRQTAEISVQTAGNT